MSQHFYYQQSYGVGPPRITWGVQRLVLLSVAVFALQLLLSIPFGSVHEAMGMVPGGRVVDWLGFSIENLSYGLIYTPLSYMFLHGSLSHLFFNMVWLVCFGPEVERRLGTRAFYRFYLFCGGLGVMANLAPWAWQRLRLYLAQSSGQVDPALLADLAPMAPLVVGASGAVLGVLVVFAMLDPDGELQFLFLPFRINRRALIFGVIVLNLLHGLGAMGGGGISIATHFGGMVAGYAYFRLKDRIPVVRFGARRQRARKPTRKTTDTAAPPEDLERLGEEIDNIFRFDDRSRGE